MPRDADEQALFERFSSRYKFAQSDLLKEMERSICGCDYGATSFATLEQVNELGDRLELGPDKRLLEVGAGSGWPGLYLAKKTGCDVTLTDIPIEGLHIAKARAIVDYLGDVSRMVVASGAVPVVRVVTEQGPAGSSGWQVYGDRGDAVRGGSTRGVSGLPPDLPVRRRLQEPQELPYVSQDGY